MEGCRVLHYCVDCQRVVLVLVALYWDQLDRAPISMLNVSHLCVEYRTRTFTHRGAVMHQKVTGFH